jgi:hypothetical protein
VLKTHHAPRYYLRPEDINARLHTVQGSSVCEWKSAARYSVVIATARRPCAPLGPMTARFAILADHAEFYAGLMDGAGVGDLRVIA